MRIYELGVFFSSQPFVLRFASFYFLKKTTFEVSFPLLCFLCSPILSITTITNAIFFSSLYDAEESNRDVAALSPVGTASSGCLLELGTVLTFLR